MGRISSRQGSAAFPHAQRAHRLGIALVAALFFGLLAAGPAMAGTVSVAGGELRFNAPLDGVNNLAITQGEGDTFTVSDSAALTPGDGCLAVDQFSATCTGVATLRVNVGPGDDSVVIAAAVASTIYGREGNDTVTGGSGPDWVEGQAGQDAINVRDGGADRVVCVDADDVTSDAGDQVDAACRNNNGVPPETAITDGPPNVVSSGDQSFSFTANEPASFNCELHGPGLDQPLPGCTSPQQVSLPSEGVYTFSVTATDEFGNVDPTPEARAVTLDTTAPEVIVTRLAPFDTSTAHFQLDAVDISGVTLQCRIGTGDAQDCSDIFTAPILADGEYVLFVTGTDAVGHATTTEVPFRINAVPGGGGTGPPTPPTAQPRRIIIESLVLIAGNPVKMSRRGLVGIRLTCAGKFRCKGRMKITTATPVSRKSRKLVTLGSKRFSIAANKKRTVKVRFSKRRQRLAKRLKRFKAKVVIHEIDQRGNPRISSRVFILRAR